MGLRQVVDGRRAFGNRRGDLPGLGVAHAGVAEAVGEADLDHLDAERADGAVVEIALAARHDDLVAHACRVGQPVHLGRVETGDAGGKADQQSRRRPGSHQTGLGPGDLGDDGAGPRLELEHVDAVLRGLDHGLDHWLGHDRAAQPRVRPAGIDDRADAQAVVDGRHGAQLCMLLWRRETATAMCFEDRVTAVPFSCSARLLDVPKDQHGGLDDAGDGLAIGHHARELPDHDIGDGLVGAELELGGDLLLALAIGRLQPGVA